MFELRFNKSNVFATIIFLNSISYTCIN